MPALPAISGLNLFAGLIFSSIGFIGFVYGKKMNLWKPLFIGIALMAYPYFIENTSGALRHRGGGDGGALFLPRLGGRARRHGLRAAGCITCGDV